jgi:hypothetical protein
MDEVSPSDTPMGKYSAALDKIGSRKRQLLSAATGEGQSENGEEEEEEEADEEDEKPQKVCSCLVILLRIYEGGKKTDAEVDVNCFLLIFFRARSARAPRPMRARRSRSSDLPRRLALERHRRPRIVRRCTRERTTNSRIWFFPTTIKCTY